MKRSLSLSPISIERGVLPFKNPLFDKHLAPIQVAVLPLSKKEELSSVAREFANSLRKDFSGISVDS